MRRLVTPLEDGVPPGTVYVPHYYDGGAIMSLVSVHLLTLLQARGVALASAVSYGALIGPAQVGARVAAAVDRYARSKIGTAQAAPGT